MVQSEQERQHKLAHSNIFRQLCSNVFRNDVFTVTEMFTSRQSEIDAADSVVVVVSVDRHELSCTLYNVHCTIHQRQRYMSARANDSRWSNQMWIIKNRNKNNNQKIKYCIPPNPNHECTDWKGKKNLLRQFLCRCGTNDCFEFLSFSFYRVNYRIFCWIIDNDVLNGARSKTISTFSTTGKWKTKLILTTLKCSKMHFPFRTTTTDEWQPSQPMDASNQTFIFCLVARATHTHTERENTFSQKNSHHYPEIDICVWRMRLPCDCGLRWLEMGWIICHFSKKYSIFALSNGFMVSLSLHLSVSVCLWCYLQHQQYSLSLSVMTAEFTFSLRGTGEWHESEWVQVEPFSRFRHLYPS